MHDTNHVIQLQKPGINSAQQLFSYCTYVNSLYYFYSFDLYIFYLTVH